MKQTGKSRMKEIAVAALLSENTIDAAAVRAGVSSRTLKNWLRDEAFQKLLREAKSEVVQGVTNQLRRAMAAAAKKLVAIMNNKKTPIAVQLSAATKILEIGFDADWTENIEHRIGILERQQEEQELRR